MLLALPLAPLRLLAYRCRSSRWTSGAVRHPRLAVCLSYLSSPLHRPVLSPTFWRALTYRARIFSWSPTWIMRQRPSCTPQRLRPAPVRVSVYPSHPFHWQVPRGSPAPCSLSLRLQALRLLLTSGHPSRGQSRGAVETAETGETEAEAEVARVRPLPVVTAPALVIQSV